ncbi:ABC transporter ATP-binding protein [Salisediminibacterium selenitireducens]|uniref:ABC transporter related protein n=1 Tax=Bacillus selenitireducens (strain ATCC 700615 / DSM 15326 / MLS10) TaxID=439292 RepID=D6XUA9_BACIE|nr:ABC transporter ATP-binding protein [Salisediminibacterium selenitireducens]ADH99395.1 ABC transporter related protein [[Bacillus] selenitireducens MLS10]
MKERIVIRNVSKNIRGKAIIKNITLSIEPGEIYGLLGPNGAGKTTTIRMMTGLMKPTGGSITINGFDLSNDFEKAISGVGAVVENPEMYEYLSGYDNLLHYQRMSPGVSKAQIQKVTERVGMEKRIHEKTGTYSLGMRQRLGLAQALLHEPDVLILDEPTNGLDPAGIREIRSYLKKLAHEDGISIIVSSHLLSEMEKMCDRIAVIQDGEIITVSDVASFVEGKEQFVTVTVTDQSKAADVIRKQLQKEVEITDLGIRLACSREEIPNVVSVLVNQGIGIYEVKGAANLTLEEQFLELTGGRSV